jgi:arylsulfatase A-like enzyme
MGRTFPHRLTGGLSTPGPDFYDAWLQTPRSVQYLLETAERAVEAEGLGTDDVPDLLSVGISTVDYCGHAFGPDSWEMQELVVQTDRLLADFLRRLGRRFRSGDLTIVLTADHGSGPLPERMAALGFPAGRIKKADVKAAIEDALDRRFGPGDWVSGQEEPGVFLNRALVTERKLDDALVQRVALDAGLSASPGFAAGFTRAQLQHGPLPDSALARQALRSFSAARSGDLFLIPKPFYYWSRYGEREEGATHGSPYEYDTHVPLIFWGAGVRPGTVARSVDMTDLAPTLAHLLGVDAPSGCDGHVLPEALR